jgi:hypothetical protein
VATRVLVRLPVTTLGVGLQVWAFLVLAAVVVVVAAQGSTEGTPALVTCAPPRAAALQSDVVIGVAAAFAGLRLSAVEVVV